MRNPRRQESETTPPNHRTIGPFDPSIIPRNAKKNKKKTKKVIKISGGGARPLGGPRPLGPFDPSIIRRKGKKKKKKKKNREKKRREHELQHAITGRMSPTNPEMNSQNKKTKNNKKGLNKIQVKSLNKGGPPNTTPHLSLHNTQTNKKKKKKKKGHQNLRWGARPLGGPSTTRSLRSIDHSQKR